MPKILIVDDDMVFRSGIAEWLDLEGFEVLQAESGADGLNIALHTPPDIVICDVVMPGMSGYDVLARFQREPGLKRIPFVLLSAQADPASIRQGMTLGADDYLTKPFTCPDLLATIESRLRSGAIRAEDEQRRLAQLERLLDEAEDRQALQMKLAEIFVGDFRDPLLRIIGGASYLRDFPDRLPEDARRARLSDIEASARVLLQMLDDSGDIARMEKLNTATVHAVFESTDLTALISTVCSEFRALAPDGHRLVFTGPEQATILTDPLLVHRIATNLISNGLKYSPPECHVYISLEKQADRVAIHVQDFGIGISEEDQKLLFKPFHRGSNVGKVRGTGLGMVIVQRAAQRLGGSVIVDSALDEGTLVTVTLAAYEPQDASLKPGSLAAGASMPYSPAAPGDQC